MTRTLVWKECREHVPFLVTGWAVFLGVTLVSAACAYFALPPHGGRFYSRTGLEMVVMLGPVLAIFLAAGASCRDLTERVYEFWRSRPISPRQLVLRKYAAGVTTLLLVVFATFLLVVVLAYSAYGESRWNNGATAVAIYYTLALVLVYSVSFFLGCVVRRTAQAAMVSAVAALVLYVLPVVFPPLERVGIIPLLMRTSMGYGIRGPGTATWLRLSIVREAPFTALALVGCAGSVALSVKAVKHGWRLIVGKRFICWAFVAVGLVLWAATAFPLATNLDCLYRQPILPGMPARKGGVADISSAGNQGALLQWERPEDGVSPTFRFSARRFNVGSGGIEMGPGVVVATSDGPVYSRLNMTRIAWYATQPERAFVLHVDIEYDRHDRRIARRYKSLRLETVAFDAEERGAIIHTIDLLEHVAAAVEGGATRMHRCEDRLLIRAGSRLIVVDVSDPDVPTVSRVFEGKDVSFAREGERYGLNSDDYRFTSVAMLPGEGIALRERMEASVDLGFGDELALEGDLAVMAAPAGLTTYRIAGYDERTVRLEMLGRRPRTPVERILVMYPGRVVLRDGLAYVLTRGPNVGMTVYDVRDPARPRRIRHYAAPHESFFGLAVLPDGKVLLGGIDLHVIEAADGRPHES